MLLPVAMSCLTFLGGCAPESGQDARTLGPTFAATDTSPAPAVSTATSVPSVIPTPTGQVPALASSVPSVLASRAPTSSLPACPLGAGLREDTIEIQLAYQSPGRLYVTGSLSLAQAYFGELETGTRVLVGPSLARLRELAEQASESGLPYEALAYSLEASRNTPIEEQADVLGATQQAASLAHEHGKLLVMGPGWGLMEQNWAQYPTMASYADLWIIQTQRLQSNPADPAYREEVERVVGQLRAGNADLSVWAQISVTPGGRVLSPDEVLAYRRAIVDLVDGVYVYEGGDPNRSETLKTIFAVVCGGNR
jgi:hypothetical protein